MAKEPIEWVICYIDASKIDWLTRDLLIYPKYRLITAYIPTVKILKKTFKGKNHYQEVPLLFNYGFFKVPRYFVWNPHFLEQMKKDIKCIYGWVKDPISLSNIEKPWKQHNPSGYALASSKEISRIIANQEVETIYSKGEIDKLKKGDIITLSGYPFEGLNAEILSIDKTKKEVEVKLLLETFMQNIKVSFDNIFYTIYRANYMNTEMRERSLEEIQERVKNIDGLFTKITRL
jgi:hypothetical protein